MLESLEVLRCGLETMLRRLEWISTLECHRNVEELFGALRARGGGWAADVVIVSCCAPDEIADDLRLTFPTSRILELVTRADPEHLAMAARTHADGYLMVHDITEATLDSTLRALIRGEMPMPAPVANYLLDRARSGDVPRSRHQPYFSPRERDVIALLLEGLSNRQIADKVGISLHSAKRHVSSVLNKVNSPSRAHFVAQMLRDDTVPAQRR
ncbi:response regulator transcription factor [Actinosynnema sp. NPDC047251]|uniref:response regulator transcription factor n=1 Tax=Saccharothrix espanaensis TaxID=103731 RepID=UPI00130E1CE3|nr:response regulator transcription factor [Saccharothrix espanaensis]